MFQPKYRLSSKILANISQIERFYGQLESLYVPKEARLNLERNNLIKSTYISNSIEGNPLSIVEVTNLLLDGRVPANRDEKEVKNYFDILNSLTEYTNRPISLSTIKEIHYLLLNGVDNKIAGEIRNKKVVVGSFAKEKGKTVLRIKHEPPFHLKTQIEESLRDLLQWLAIKNGIPAILKAGIFHHEFVYLHPFEDGNGRVCRLLTALIFLRNNYLINKYFVLDDYYDIDRILYSDKLHSADKGYKTEWLEYFSDGVKYSLQAALGKVKSSFNALKIENRPTVREQEVLKLFEGKREVTSQEIANILNISRQQAHNLLSSLVEKSILGKKGETKASYYFLK